ncbi:hypothetical protein OH76DRAFT_846698 [Lentinus brumalis]|uniref:Uncharacterized protein n=1 Tax=Lentinus brumalis TaxID=2498619 RepID=A0A371DQV9_9APHY|nr:hypothetical protein OH76DRAFT_846698 [Polyporus brumalis]
MRRPTSHRPEYSSIWKICSTGTAGLSQSRGMSSMHRGDIGRLRCSRKAKQERLEEGVTYVAGNYSAPSQHVPVPASLRPPSPGPFPRGGWSEPGPPAPTTLPGGTYFMQPYHTGGRAGTF